jgi:hypothetical protein
LSITGEHCGKRRGEEERKTKGDREKQLGSTPFFSIEIPWRAGFQ